MLRTLFTIVIIVELTIWTTLANESECVREELERELQEYIKLDSWQQLLSQHLKFHVTENGELISGRKRLKFGTILHNAIFGCDHERDDEVDECPRIYDGVIDTCKKGKYVRTAMFRAARCVFVESSVKHIVLSDALLDAYPTHKLDKLPIYADKPIREFGETIVNVLTTLRHGEPGKLGELMTLNLYLNNRFNTVFMYKIPVEPITSPVDFEVARKRMRNVHLMILEKLYAFWDTWCSDKDIVTQYRVKHKNDAFLVVLAEMDKNIKDADDLVRGLNVSDNVVDLDFDPKKIALVDFVDGMISSRSMPDAVLADLKLRSFEASYEFNPQALYEYHNSTFETVYTCFYWMTITHLKLAVKLINETEKRETSPDDVKNLVINIVKYIRPLTVFNINRSQFVLRLPTAASKNLTMVLAYLMKMYYLLRKDYSKEAILSSASDIQTLADLLSNDSETIFNTNATAIGSVEFDNYDYETAFNLMKSNYQEFARLASATSGFKEDRKNLMKLKKSLLFLSDVVKFSTEP